MKFVKALMCLFLTLALCGCGIFKRTEETTSPGNPDGAEMMTYPYHWLPDAERLMAVRVWEAEGNPYTLMAFDIEGTGYLVRFGVTYSHTWRLEGNILVTETELRPEVTQQTVYEFQMEENGFILKNTVNENTARFFVAGTQSKELPEDGHKDPDLYGVWLPEDEAYVAYIFAPDGEKSGRFSSNDKDRRIRSELVWTVHDYYLYIYYVNDAQYKYNYIVSGNRLTLYRDGFPTVTYRRAE